MPFLPLYFQQLGVTDVGAIAMWSGLSLGVTPALTALLSPFWGRLADRYGRKIMVERSLVSFIFLMGAMAFVTHPWQVFALRAAQGLFAGYGVVDADDGGRLRAARTASPIQSGSCRRRSGSGPAIGPIVGGAVAQLVGLRHAFLVTAGFYVVALVLVFVMYDERTAATPRRRTQRAERVTFRNVLAFENFILLMVVIFGLQFVDRSFGPVLPLYIAQLGTPRRAGAARIGRAVFDCGGGRRDRASRLRHAPAPRLGAPRHRRRASRSRPLGRLIYSGCGRSWLLLVATPVFGLAIGVATTAAYTAASGVIPASARGAGFGLSRDRLARRPGAEPDHQRHPRRDKHPRRLRCSTRSRSSVLAGMVARIMVATPIAAAAAPATEEL